MLLRIRCPHCHMPFLMHHNDLLFNDEILMLADEITNNRHRAPEWEA